MRAKATWTLALPGIEFSVSVHVTDCYLTVVDGGDDERVLGDALHVTHHAIFQVHKPFAFTNAMT